MVDCTQNSESGSPDETAERMCRLCFEGEQGDGNPLISPCDCSGSLKYIHQQCLYSWLAQLKDQGQYRKARRCEICHARWDPQLVPPDLSCQGWGWDTDSEPGSPSGRDAARIDAGGPYSLVRILRRRVRRALAGIRAGLHTQPWPLFLLRVWRLYIVCSAFGSALTGGAAGMQRGVRLGRSLVQEQSSAVVALLAAVAEMMGTPIAEVLWIQVVAAVGCALVSEFLYTVALGGLVGAVYGFMSGYVGAVRGSATLLVNTVTKLARASSKVGLRLFNALAGATQGWRRAALRAVLPSHLL